MFLILLIVSIRPLLGPASCYFSVSCTSFAREQLQKKTLPFALYAIICRLFICSPFYGMWLVKEPTIRHVFRNWKINK